MDYNLGFFWKYKGLLIQGLQTLNLTLEAEKMDNYFIGPKASQNDASFLENNFWNTNFKEKIEPILIQFLTNKKAVLLDFQEL